MNCLRAKNKRKIRELPPSYEFPSVYWKIHASQSRAAAVTPEILIIERISPIRRILLVIKRNDFTHVVSSIDAGDDQHRHVLGGGGHFGIWKTRRSKYRRTLVVSRRHDVAQGFYDLFGCRLPFPEPGIVCHAVPCLVRSNRNDQLDNFRRSLWSWPAWSPTGLDEKKTGGRKRISTLRFHREWRSFPSPFLSFRVYGNW